MIYGLTHTIDDKPIIRMTVAKKITIGEIRQTDGGKSYPSKIDHFRIQAKNGKGEWVEDVKTTALLAKDAPANQLREIPIVLLADDPDSVFKTERAVWAKSAKLCEGNGRTAQRRADMKPTGDWAPHYPCAEDGCQLTHTDCKPSGDLYFMLWDQPVIGSVCRFHTGSYASIKNIWSSLQEIRNLSGGRLQGIPLVLTLNPIKTNYRDAAGAAKTSNAFAVNIEFRADDARIIPRLIEQSITYRALPPVAIETDEETIDGPWLATEFYTRPANSQDALRAAVVETPEDDLVI